MAIVYDPAQLSLSWARIPLVCPSHTMKGTLYFRGYPASGTVVLALLAYAVVVTVLLLVGNDQAQLSEPQQQQQPQQQREQQLRAANLNVPRNATDIGLDGNVKHFDSVVDQKMREYLRWDRNPRTNEWEGMRMS